jgi:hypothetical protein
MISSLAGPIIGAGKWVSEMGAKPTVRAELFDCGRLIGVAVEFKGQRKTICIANPLWAEIDADWQRAHSAAGKTGASG